MASGTTPPDPKELLPPILACLPTAFVSPRPPPALLPLLSPILQQRVQIQCQGASATDSWLTLLCWRPDDAAKLPDIVQDIQIEPHPISGEVEFDDVEALFYRRLDEETLHVRIDVQQFDLSMIYLWCEGSGWKLAEVKALEDGKGGHVWHESIAAADKDLRERREPDTRSAAGARTAAINGDNEQAGTTAKDGDDDDDAYWAAYDATPGRTPGSAGQSAPPPPASSVPGALPSTSELEYFARYLNEVQPAMDPHDPAEQGLPAGQSTLAGNELIPDRSASPRAGMPPDTDSSDRGLVHDHDHAALEDTARSVQSTQTQNEIASSEQPIPAPPQAELAVRHHISTDLKSLYRLARGAGIDRAEFERLVRTELDCLSMLDLEP